MSESGDPRPNQDQETYWQEDAGPKWAEHADQMDRRIGHLGDAAMERLGLGYEAIREIKQDIIYCSLNGYGANGPMRDAPAYDHIIQGFSGLMSLTGTEDSGPLRYGVPITDWSGVIRSNRFG